MVIFNVGSTSFCVKQALKKMLHSCARCCFLRKLTLEISTDLQRRSNNNSPAFHVKRDTSGRGKDGKKRPRRGPMKDNVGNDDFPDTYVLDPPAGGSCFCALFHPAVAGRYYCLTSSGCLKFPSIKQLAPIRSFRKPPQKLVEP